MCESRGDPMKLGDELEVLYTQQQIAGRVRELAAEIERDHRGKELVLVGVLKGAFMFVSDLARQIEAKHVIIVEDIVDTGLTMRYLLDNLSTRRPASVKICALLQKPSRLRTRIPIQYLGFTVPDLFVVGYGLDSGEKYRTLPFIGAVKGA